MGDDEEVEIEGEEEEEEEEKKMEKKDNCKWRNTVILMFYVPWSVIIIRWNRFGV